MYAINYGRVNVMNKKLSLLLLPVLLLPASCTDDSEDELV